MDSFLFYDFGPTRFTVYGNGARNLGIEMILNIAEDVLTMGRRNVPESTVILVENTDEYPPPEYSWMHTNGTTYVVGIFPGFLIIMNRRYVKENIIGFLQRTEHVIDLD